MNKKELKKHFSEDFIKVKSAILGIIQNSNIIATGIAEDLAQGDFSSIEEYNLLIKSINDATKNFNELYQNAPKIISSIDKEIKDEKKNMKLEDIIDD